MAMFAVLTRPVPRRAISQTIRHMSDKPLFPSQKDEETAERPLPAASPPSTVPSLDFSPTEPLQERQRTGARSSKDSLTSVERKRRVTGRILVGVLVLAVGLNAVHMGREWDGEELHRRKMVRTIVQIGFGRKLSV
jgi:hypothetical protein